MKKKRPVARKPKRPVGVRLPRVTPPRPTDGLLGLREASQWLGIAEVTLRLWSGEGKIPYVRLGRRKLFHREALALFAERNTVKATAPTVTP